MTEKTITTTAELIKTLEDNNIEVKNGSIKSSDRNKAITVLNSYSIAILNVDNTDFGLNNNTKNVAMFSKLMKKQNKKLLETINEKYELYMSDRHIWAITLDENAENRLLYFVNFEFDRVNSLKIVSQLKLWRGSTDSEFLRVGMAGRVFFQYIMPLADGIASDNMQTSPGQKFWEDRVGEAFQKGYNVYIADESRKTFTKLLNFQEFNSNIHNIWGDKSSFKYVRLVITEKEL